MKVDETLRFQADDLDELHSYIEQEGMLCRGEATELVRHLEMARYDAYSHSCEENCPESHGGFDASPWDDILQLHDLPLNDFCRYIEANDLISSFQDLLRCAYYSY